MAAVPEAGPAIEIVLEPNIRCRISCLLALLMVGDRLLPLGITKELVLAGDVSHQTPPVCCWLHLVSPRCVLGQLVAGRLLLPWHSWGMWDAHCMEVYDAHSRGDAGAFREEILVTSELLWSLSIPCRSCCCVVALFEAGNRCLVASGVGTVGVGQLEAVPALLGRKLCPCFLCRVVPSVCWGPCTEDG